LVAWWHELHAVVNESNAWLKPLLSRAPIAFSSRCSGSVMILPINSSGRNGQDFLPDRLSRR